LDIRLSAPGRNGTVDWQDELQAQSKDDTAQPALNFGVDLSRVDSDESRGRIAEQILEA
jgi:hypothetical protein